METLNGHVIRLGVHKHFERGQHVHEDIQERHLLEYHCLEQAIGNHKPNPSVCLVLGWGDCILLDLGSSGRRLYIRRGENTQHSNLHLPQHLHIVRLEDNQKVGSRLAGMGLHSLP